MPTKHKPLPSQEYLLELFDFDAASGRLYWRPRPVGHFKSGACSADRRAKIFNRVYAGKPVSPNPNAEGYRVVCLDGIAYKAHRIIWKMWFGDEPDEIDHQNGVRADNRIENLRGTDRSGNQRNATTRKNNKSGCMGVVWDRQHQKWRVIIRRDGRPRHVGLFRNKERAIAARKAAELAAGYHQNHGRAAN